MVEGRLTNVRQPYPSEKSLSRVYRSQPTIRDNINQLFGPVSHDQGDRAIDKYFPESYSSDSLKMCNKSYQILVCQKAVISI